MSKRRTTRQDPGSDRGSERFALDAARLASELKCSEVVVLDLRSLSQVCDYMLVASGTSERQMRAVAQQLEDLGKECGSPPYRQSRDGGDSWIVIDFVDVVVHLFEPEQRAFYDVDGLWADAPRLRWRATVGSDAARA